ncbi:MAG: DUF2937 family protein [Beijerinckiaceae bacterium]|nr:DUF2937 family protein [Beijerinckiaceae bacterium]
MIVRTLALAAGIAGAVTASQLPEYAQQYRQRLGGAIDEIARIMAEFDADAARLGMSREQGIARLSSNADSFVSDRGARLREDSARLARLQRQFSSLQSAGPFARVAIMASELDTSIAQRAWGSFEPAVPMTIEGAALGGAGFLGGYGFMQFILWPVGRRRKLRVEGARR